MFKNEPSPGNLANDPQSLNADPRLEDVPTHAPQCCAVVPPSPTAPPFGILDRTIQSEQDEEMVVTLHSAETSNRESRKGTR